MTTSPTGGEVECSINGCTRPVSAFLAEISVDEWLFRSERHWLDQMSCYRREERLHRGFRDRPDGAA